MEDRCCRNSNKIPRQQEVGAMVQNGGSPVSRLSQDWSAQISRTLPFSSVTLGAILIVPSAAKPGRTGCHIPQESYGKANWAMPVFLNDGQGGKFNDSFS
jgi:hypothetical protein